MQFNPFHPNFFIKLIWRKRRSERRLIKLRDGLVNYSAHIVHVTPQSNILELCQKHGTDKGATDIATHACGGLAGRNNTHNYAPYYDFLFAPKRLQVKNLLECGIGSVRPIDGSMSWASDAYKPGASLRMWQDYFPNAKIVGLDIDEHSLFTDERIATYQVDQTDPESIRKFKSECDRNFDIIIDDGLHTPFAGITLFNNIIDRLDKDGIYVIEDLQINDQIAYREFFVAQSQYFVKFVTLPVEQKKGNISNDTLAVITKI